MKGPCMTLVPCTTRHSRLADTVGRVGGLGIGTSFMVYALGPSFAKKVECSLRGPKTGHLTIFLYSVFMLIRSIGTAVTTPVMPAIPAT